MNFGEFHDKYKIFDCGLIKCKYSWFLKFFIMINQLNCVWTLKTKEKKNSLINKI